MKNNRQEAIEAGETQYFTGKPCKHGHIQPRWTQTGACMRCCTIATQKSRDNYRINRLKKLAKDEASRNEQV